ncbi:hypothetical protein COV93_08315 [Candidatus Woesearchaeota archaeon CG11_big_fil_rev_8_21_14_0_20_43_8]|nr:MAG: hypothetical protein COV93_08315 [Candidatus Woesearchaeota archaeon CG11_big_fil_rev_8_21_14_0_20_43_8]
MQGGFDQMPGQDQFGAPAQMAPEEDASNERVVELIEALIDEKWSDFTENVNRIIEWKDKTEGRINEIETTVKDLRGEFDKLHNAILEKVGQYDQNIHDVGIEIKALEKVFQKILPTLTENVNELSRITRDFKKRDQAGPGTQQ